MDSERIGDRHGWQTAGVPKVELGVGRVWRPILREEGKPQTLAQ